MTSSKVPTNDQIIREAQRRWEVAPGEQKWRLEHYVIEVVRENWIPPEPVDPDILAFREWAARRREANGSTDWASAYRQGRFDHTDFAQAYLAGAHMARERERARARKYVDAKSARAREFRAALAKHQGEA